MVLKSTFILSAREHIVYTANYQENIIHNLFTTSLVRDQRQTFDAGHPPPDQLFAVLSKPM